MRNVLAIILLIGLVNSAFYISDVKVGTYEPGSSGYLSFVLGSTETSEISGINVDVYFPSYVSGRQTFYVGSLSPGSSTYISVPFTIKNTTPTGVYSIEIKAKGFVKELDTSDIYFTERSSFATLAVLEKPVVSLSVSPKEVGEYTKIKLTPVIEEGEPKNIVVSAEQPFALEPTTISLDSTKEVYLDARGVKEGQNQLKLLLTYNDKLGNSYSKEVIIPITVRKDVSTISISAKNIVQGKVSKATLTIKNNGNAIEDLKLIFNSGLHLDSNELIVGSLNANEQKTISTNIFTTLEPGLSYVPVQAEWVENGERKRTTLYIASDILPDNNLKTYIEAKPEPLDIGKEAKLNVVVANAGGSDVSAVSVKIEGINLLSISNEQYIGELAKDDFSSVQFSIMPLKEKNDLNITITYTDKKGTKQVQRFNYKIKARQAKDEQNILPIAAGVVGLAGIYLVWKKMKKRKG